MLPVAACALLMIGFAAPAGAASNAPVNTALPTIAGIAKEGGKLEAHNGTWEGSAPLSLTYQWTRCNASGEECVNIGSATASAYKPTHEDVGQTLRVVETATNSEGSSSATSLQTAAVGVAPKKITGPSISGSLKDGQLLIAQSGTWQGTPPPSFSYQWQSCAKTSCSNIAGATASTYRLATSEIGQRLRVLVKAKNTAGQAKAASPRTAIVGPGAPVSITAPGVSGTPLPGQTLEAATGTWAGTAPFTYTYQWMSCNIADECLEIAGATGSTYTVEPLDVASTLEVVVTAKNAQGTASATSPATGVVGALLPSNTSLPAISGLSEDGQILSAVTGTWEGTAPITYSYQWLLCNSAGEACKEISGAVGSTLALVSGDVGSTLRVVVTATNSAGSTSATSAATALVGALLPSNTSLPSITGALEDGGLLSAGTGSWSGTEPLTYGYQWLLCNAAGEACKEISGAVGSTLALVSGDVGSTLRVVVTATNGGGSTSATSAATGLVAALLPSNTVLPSITGVLKDGGLLSAATGTWSGTEPLSYSYTWELCNASGEGCKEIEDAVGSTLLLSSADVGSTLRVVVTASNGGGSASATSAATGLIAALLPSNTVLPSVTGTLKDGQVLTGSTGTWSGTTPISYGYQWLLCNGAGEACKEISGAVGSTLALVSGDVGSTLRVVVTASNGGGSASATSAATGLVAALLPSNTVLPSVTGTLKDGQVLTGSTGTWSGTTPISYGYQWLLCNGAGEACKEISGAVGSTLALVSGDVGSTLRVVVTASNGGGSASATSAATGLVAALLPSNTVLPSVTGTLKDGQVLTGSTGTWSGTTPISYGYQWLLCNGAGEACKEISGAVGSTLALVSGDVGSTLRVVVTASNGGGSASATSAATGLVAALLPSNTVLPSVTGTLKDGQVLTGSTGTWSGTTPISYGYQWLLCNGAGEACKEISGAVGSTLALVSGDVGSTLRVVVTASNGGGSASATSAATGLVAALLPSNTVLPSVTGTLKDGQVLTGSTGTWSGTTPISYGYQWLLCNGAGEACKEISGAVGSTLALVSGDVGSTLRVVVTASNGGGSASATSAATGLVAALLPSNTVLPSVTGTLKVGQLLTASTGTWSGTTPISYGYQWLLCNKAGEACTEIAKATSSTYLLSALDVLLPLRVTVTATNAAGSVPATSNPTGLIEGL